MNFHLRDRFFTAKKLMRSVGTGSRFIGLHLKQRRKIIINDRNRISLRSGPNGAIAIDHHLVKDFKFALTDLVVRKLIRLEFDKRPRSIDRVTISGSIMLEPESVLFVDRFAQRFELLVKLELARCAGLPKRTDSIAAAIRRLPFSLR